MRLQQLTLADVLEVHAHQVEVFARGAGLELVGRFFLLELVALAVHRHRLFGERLRIVFLQKALGLIEEGEYGKCEECGEQISGERLRALPFATTCVDCKRDQERKSSRD